MLIRVQSREENNFLSRHVQLTLLFIVVVASERKYSKKHYVLDSTVSLAQKLSRSQRPI